MSPLNHTATGEAGLTTARYRQAAQAGDIEGVMATLAPDAVLYSPITDKIAFRGHAEIRELLRSVFETVDDMSFFADVGDAHTRALFYRGRVGGQPLEEATRVELDGQGQITMLTMFFRPLPGLATLAAELAPRVVTRRHGPARAWIAWLVMTPLGFLTRLGDRFVRFFT